MILYGSTNSGHSYKVKLLLTLAKIEHEYKWIDLSVAKKFNTFNVCENGDQSIIEWLSWETNRIGFSLPNLRHAMGCEPQPDNVTAFFRNRTIADLNTLNNHLSTTKFLCGNSATIADISCAAYLFWLHQVDISITDYSNIERWVERIKSLQNWLSPDLILKPVVT